MEETNGGNLSTIIIGIIIILVVVVAGGVFVLLQNDDSASSNDATDGASTTAQDTQSSNDTPTNTDTTEEPSNSSTGEVVEVTMELDDYKFSPDTITASPGDTVRVTLISKSHEHDFRIDELNVASNLLGNGESQTIEFRIPSNAAGKTFEYYCSVGIHRQLGMVGDLVIQ